MMPLTSRAYKGTKVRNGHYVFIGSELLIASRSSGGFTPPFGEVNSPLRPQTLPLPVFRLTRDTLYDSLSLWSFVWTYCRRQALVGHETRGMTRTVLELAEPVDRK